MKFSRIYIIAEMACSHEGKPELARKIIDGAGAAGADAVQFQIWKPEEIIVPYHPEFKNLKEIELSHEVWADLAGYVRNNYPSMEIIACVYQLGGVDFCQSIQVDAFKIHSSDLSNPSLVKYVAETGKRIDLSIGASSLDEIEAALEWIRETSNSEIWLMYGYQNFPTPTNEINLTYMMKLKELFELPVGYQDHSDAETDAAFWLPAAALGMGVNILEKHITHDRSFRGADHQAALNPNEFGLFVTMVREIEGAKGLSVPKPFTAEEQKYRKYSKKSIVAGRDLPAGTTICEEDIRFMRTETLGLPPDQAYRLIGKKLTTEVGAYQLIKEEDVQLPLALHT